MPIIKTLADLFRRGASFIAEQFTLGRTRSATLEPLLVRRYGVDLLATQRTISELEARTRAANVAGRQIMAGIIPTFNSLPLWEASQFPQQFIISGLSGFSSESAIEGVEKTIWQPFVFSDIKILQYQDVIRKLQDAISAGSGDIVRYLEKISRLEQYIKYLRITQQNPTIKAEIFGVYRGF